MKKVLAPHKDQDGWAYVRVRRDDPFGEGHVDALGNARFESPMRSRCRYPNGDDAGTSIGFTAPVYYNDSVFPDSRIISSRRVERAVETDDFLRLCAKEQMTLTIHPDMDVWLQGPDDNYAVHKGRSIREAYYRYYAANGGGKR